MKTYLTLYFSSEGNKPSEVTKTLTDMGFEPIYGAFDFVYDWKGNPPVEDVIKFGDRIKSLLKKHNVYFRMESV